MSVSHFPDPPKNISVSVSPSDSELEGSSVTLTCISDANPAVKNYTWYRVNGDENIIQFGQSFIIDRVDSSHSGEYYCEALNEHGLKKSSSVKLDIECKSHSYFRRYRNKQCMRGNPWTLNQFGIVMSVLMNDYNTVWKPVKM